MKPWDAEHRADLDLAKRLIEIQFPNLKPANLKLLGEGWDNLAYEVNQKFVFRFPRRQISVDLIRTESEVLPSVAPRLPLPIPNPIYLGQPTKDYPWPFAGYKMLEGQTACQVHLNSEERAHIAEPLAQFLKALHSMPPPAIALPDRIRRLDVEVRWPKTYDNLCKIDELGLFPNTKDLFDLLDSLKEVRNTGPQQTLCHGDLYARHLLINNQRQLCGVIDWGDVHIGNPAVDLAVLFAFLPQAARDSFLETYGPLDKNTKQLALIRALFSASMFTVYSHDIGDADLLREGLVALGLILEGNTPKRRLQIKSYDPTWPKLFKQEAEKLKQVFGNDLIDIHHFGSTAVPGLAAKPTIDILIVLPKIEMADTKNTQIRELGYMPRGAYGIGGHERHRYFRKGHQFHIHVFEPGDSHIAWNLSFRDYLCKHPQEAKEYETLKLKLVKQYSSDPPSYRAGKKAFMDKIKSGAIPKSRR